MASITTSVVLLYWSLISVVLMLLANSLSTQLRKSDYAGLTVVCNYLGPTAAYQLVTDLLGTALTDTTEIWGNIKDVMIEVINQMPPEWSMMII